ncbi:MAG: ComEC/Rec2 family competence protein [Clostridia bacterium]|nr:ComEC/Rec2 family competence protein [Clostridia bacterium]
MLAVRKAAGFFFVWILTGCILAYSTTLSRLLTGTAAAVLVLAVLILAYRKRFWYAVFLPLLAGALLASCGSLVLFDVYAASVQSMAAEGSVISVHAEVKEIVYTNAYSGRYICRITGEGIPYSLVVDSPSPDLAEGQILQGELQLRDWEDTDDGFDEKQYYLAEGVTAAAEDLSLHPTGETRWHLRRLFQSWNQRLSDRISAHVRRDGLPLAMLLGNRDGLEDTVKRDFRRLGVYHLIAVSGTHFSLLAAFSEWFMMRLRIRPAGRYWLLGILTILYMLLTGLSASVRRAGLMFLISLLCRRLGLQVRYFSSLNIACGLILLADPFAVMDMGLHLSYLAVCGCILFIRINSLWHALRNLGKTPIRLDASGQPLPPSPKRRRFTLRFLAAKILSMLLLNLVITGMTLPLSWLYFGELSLLSPLANLFYIPMTGVMIFLSLLYLLLYPLGFLITPMAGLISGFAGLLEGTASLFSPLPHAVVSLSYPFMPLFLVLLADFLLLLPVLRHKMRGIAAVLAILVLMCGTIFAYDAVHADDTAVIYRNDKVKDGLVLSVGNKVLLADMSDGSRNFTNQLLAEMTALRATELEGYLLTHYHNRHVGTLQDLTDNWILRRLYLPAPVTEEEEAVYTALLDIAEEKNIEMVLFHRETAFGPIQIRLAERTYLSRSTHPVTGLVLTSAGEKMVYVSSSFCQGDPTLLTEIGEADVCIFGAHSPVHKKTFALPLVRQPKIFVWNGDSAYYYDGALPCAGLELHGCSRFVYRFPDTTG